MALTFAGSVVFEEEDVTFSQSTARVAGGAVSVRGSGIGPRFAGLTFVSNRTPIGGAVYLTSSGTTITANQSGVPIENHTWFERCVFICNGAEATGGAIEARAGFVVITNTSFTENTTATGGALRLSSSTSLHNCSFVNSTSDEGEGAAISNVGFASSMVMCSFIDNAFNCKPGEFLDYSEARVVSHDRSSSPRHA